MNLPELIKLDTSSRDATRNEQFLAEHRAMLMPWVILILGFIVSAAVWTWAAVEQRKQIELSFIHRTLEAHDALKQHILHNMELLRGIQAIMHSGSKVDRQVFHRYLQSLQLSAHYTVIRAVQFARYIRRAEKPAFEAQVRADRTLVPQGYPHFRVKPEGDRPEYVVVEFNEPMAGNEAAFGHDQIAEPKRREVMIRARDSGLPAASAPITLVQDQEKLAGFVVRFPIYAGGASLLSVDERRAAYRGQVTGVFRAKDLVVESMQSSFLNDYGVQLRDVGREGDSLRVIAPASDSLLYANDRYTQLTSIVTAKDLLLRHYDVPVAGRQWRLTFAAPVALPLYSSMSLTILSGALMVTLLIYRVMRGLTTERARAESLADQMTAHLREHRDLLQREVDARTADLSRAKDDAEAANRAKSEFLSSMSHELRTPMHAILSFAKLGTDRMIKELPTSRSLHYLQRISESGERLMKLLNNLLDLAKLEAGKMEYDFAPYDVRLIIDDAVEELLPMSQEKKLEIVTSYSASNHLAQCDSLRIGQVMRNILGNAIKFSPAERRITVGTRDAIVPGAHGSAAPIDAIQVEVIDRGIGIPPAELKAIFDKFVQSSKTKSGAGGTGLGLAICREIVADHGGQLSAANHPDGGAIFTLTLPARTKSGSANHADLDSSKVHLSKAVESNTSISA